MTKIRKKYLDVSFDDYKTPTSEHKRLLEFMQKGEFNKNVIISGSYGLGKTLICYCLINKHERKRNDYAYSTDKFYMVKALDLLTELKMSWKDDSNVYVSKVKNQPVLIIDDLMLQKSDDNERAYLNRLLDHRHDEELITIVTTNYKLKDLPNYIGGRNFDRLKGEYFELTGDSMR